MRRWLRGETRPRVLRVCVYVVFPDVYINQINDVDDLQVCETAACNAAAKNFVSVIAALSIITVLLLVY